MRKAEHAYVPTYACGVSNIAHYFIKSRFSRGLTNWAQFTIAMLKKSEKLIYRSVILIYYLTHCNTTQIWSWCLEYSPFMHNGYPAIYVVSCVREKNGKIEIISTASSDKYQAIFCVYSQDNIVKCSPCLCYFYLSGMNLHRTSFDHRQKRCSKDWDWDSNQQMAPLL